MNDLKKQIKKGDIVRHDDVWPRASLDCYCGHCGVVTCVRGNFVYLCCERGGMYFMQRIKKEAIKLIK